MRFLSKIRERQFAKKCGGAYNLSRAVLAGVLAAGCLMPGFAEAATEPELVTFPGSLPPGYWDLERTQNENTVTIKVTNDSLPPSLSPIYRLFINWSRDDEESVEGCKINVNDVNSANPLTITPEIRIAGGSVDNADAISNTVNISNVTFENMANICGGYSVSGTANKNSVSISDSNFKGNVYGGYSDSGALQSCSENTNSNGTVPDNTVTDNTVTIIDTTFTSTSNIYGGYTSGNGTVTGNKVEISGNTTFAFAPTSKIYGGYSVDGQAKGNSVSISDDGTFNNAEVRGGYSRNGEANTNSVSISGGTFNSAVFGGDSDSYEANYNKVIISGGEFSGRVYGGRGATKAEGNSVSISGGTIKGAVMGGEGFNANDNQVIISGDGTFGGGTNFSFAYGVYGGYGDRSANKNSVSISGGTFNYGVYGGWADSNSGTANYNQVIISGDGTFNNDVFGGRADSNSGTANYNQVIISGGTFNGYVFGGGQFYLEDGETVVNGNSVIISGGTFRNIYGGYVDSYSGTANYNKVILVGNKATYKFTDTQGAEQTITGSGNINIQGAVFVGSGHYSGTPSGNEIHVYGSNTKVGKIGGFNTLHFFIDDRMNFGETMLTINGFRRDNGDMIYDNVSIPNEKLAVTVSGKPNPSVNNNTANTITLVDYPNGTIDGFENDKPVDVKIGATLSGDGSVALSGDKKDLVLTLNVVVNENGKSLVETRAAAAFVVNNMSDFMLGTGMEQAKAAAGGVTPIDAGTMAPFAAIGGSNMRYTTGSYVDVNGWNGVVGFAKQADKLLFGVAVEHGRGNYDSYLDNGVHASGDIKSTGGVIFGEYKLDNGVHYDAALRAGRVKSDYNSTATSYDESSAYYGFSLGGGKELTVSDKATLDVYGRYYFSHTNGSDVSIATGEEIDFDAVNSHRLRIGGRYTTTLTEKSKAYAGLAWQYEFGGDAKAAINGYSAPTPSLQGHSAIVEAGYKLNAGKNLTLDFNLNGAMGKQRGIGGGIGAQWMF